MTSRENTNRFTESLTRDNTVLLLVDHQVGLFAAIRDYSPAELKHNVVALAKVARILGIPTLVTTTAEKFLWGPIAPELKAVLDPSVQVIDRTTVNAWTDPRIPAAVASTGRKKLIIAGISTDVCLTLPALSATGAGYDVYGVVDASGTINETKRTTAMLRMQQAGVIVVDHGAVIVEMLGDNADPLAPKVYEALDVGFAIVNAQLREAYGQAAAQG